MPRAKRTLPVKPHEREWFARLVTTTWPDQPPDQCHPCARTYTPQIRSGPYTGRSVIRLLWCTHHGKELRAGEQLHQTCQTPNCGNVHHWTRMSEEAQRIRDAWFSGAFKNVKDVVQHLNSPYARVTANQIITRRRHAALPDSKQERNLRNQGLLPNQESDLMVQTDGRIIGPDGRIFQNIRQAELATNLDRAVIASYLNRAEPINGWRYHPGEIHDVPGYDTGLDLRKGLNPDVRQGVNFRRGCPDLPLDNEAP